MPGIVDPRPQREAAIRAKEAELAAAADEDQRTRLKAELDELKGGGDHQGFLRRFLLGFGHRSVPW